LAWFVVPVALGAGMIAIIYADAETFDLAPRQIVSSSMLTFFNCGIVVGLIDSGFNDYWAF